MKGVAQSQTDEPTDSSELCRPFKKRSAHRFDFRTIMSALSPPKAHCIPLSCTKQQTDSVSNYHLATKEQKGAQRRVNIWL